MNRFFVHQFADRTVHCCSPPFNGYLARVGKQRHAESKLLVTSISGNQLIDTDYRLYCTYSVYSLLPSFKEEINSEIKTCMIPCH